MTMKFVVVIRQDGEILEIVGPYTSFKKAENDAKAWDGWLGYTTVQPLVKEPEFPS